MTHKLSEEFGQRLIEAARDTPIRASINILDSTTRIPLYRDMALALSTLNSIQQEAVKELIYMTVDSTLHETLLFFEGSDHVIICLQSEDEVIDDIRKLLDGDFQGYAFIWAAKYSQQPFSMLVKRSEGLI